VDTLPTSPTSSGEFTVPQKEYLQGFMAGVVASGQFPFVGLTTGGQLTGTPQQAASGNLGAPPVEDTVFGTPVSELCKEELWKHEENGLDCWERLLKHAEADQKPDPENTYRFRFHGLFYVAPAQDSFMLRLRVPACEITSHQLRGLADLADDLGGGYSHVTTRGNIQIREFKPRDIVRVLTRVQDLGLTSRCSGVDNIRNITASPNSGFDPDELLDVRPFAQALQHYILNHRDLTGLPRKFNVAFDSGGSISAAVDTNDIGFFACRVSEKSLANLGSRKADVAPGVCFRVYLGGITGHRDFARDTGLLIKPSEAVAVAVAMIRVFNENGDRTNRKKARLKYLLEKWGVEKFLEETAKKLAFPLVRLPQEGCEARRPVVKQGWLGVQRQANHGFNSIGIGIPVGRMNGRQMRALADLAANYGKGELRLTVWQSVIIPHVPEAFTSTVKRSAERLGFFVDPHDTVGGVVACTGNRGCKYAASDTKGHAISLIKNLRDAVPNLGSPVNIHFTGCPNSCAQHYCGDIGLIGVKMPDGSEGYHIVLGGGMDQEQGIAREIFRGVRADEVNPLIKKVLNTYQARRESGETFVQWSRRLSVGELQEVINA